EAERILAGFGWDSRTSEAFKLATLLSDWLHESGEPDWKLDLLRLVQDERFDSSPCVFDRMCVWARSWAWDYVRFFSMFPWMVPGDRESCGGTGETWNLGEGNHDEGTICGGFGGLCPLGSASDMMLKE